MLSKIINKKIVLLSCCISSLLMASEKDSKAFLVDRNDGLYAHYYGRHELTMPKKQVTYKIFIFDPRVDKAVWLDKGQPVRAMQWDQKGILHIYLENSNTQTFCLDD